MVLVLVLVDSTVQTVLALAFPGVMPGELRYRKMGAFYCKVSENITCSLPERVRGIFLRQRRFLGSLRLCSILMVCSVSEVVSCRWE